jgi:hypothetical protein
MDKRPSGGATPTLSRQSTTAEWPAEISLIWLSITGKSRVVAGRIATDGHLNDSAPRRRADLSTNASSNTERTDMAGIVAMAGKAAVMGR